MAAPKGNQFAKDHGRPELYSEPEAMQEKIDQYFAETKNITITGLAFYLGFESRQSFYDYEKKESFTYTIKKARCRVEQYYEENLLSKYATGAIFALKNMDWKDKIVSDQNHSGEIVITRKIIGG